MQGALNLEDLKTYIGRKQRGTWNAWGQALTSEHSRRSLKE
jgi:hypothetical protein